MAKLQGEAGRPMRIESSTNGVNWRLIAEATAGEDGVTNVFDRLPVQVGAFGSRVRAITVDNLVAEVAKPLPFVVSIRTSGNTNLVEGSTNALTLTASANGGAGQTGHWFRDDVPIADGLTLSMWGVDPAAPGGGRAVVTSGELSATSSPRTIAFMQEPTIGNPRVRDLVVGDTATLTFDVTGSPPLHYFWYHDGQRIPGGTNAIWTLGPATLTDAGNYTLAVTNLAGSATSPPLLLRVTAEEHRPLLVGFVDGRFTVTMQVAAGAYDWQEAESLGEWRSLFHTNLLTGDFRFTASEQAAQGTRFFRLKPPP